MSSVCNAAQRVPPSPPKLQVLGPLLTGQCRRSRHPGQRLVPPSADQRHRTGLPCSVNLGCHSASQTPPHHLTIDWKARNSSKVNKDGRYLALQGPPGSTITLQNPKSLFLSSSSSLPPPVLPLVSQQIGVNTGSAATSKVDLDHRRPTWGQRWAVSTKSAQIWGTAIDHRLEILASES
jgi:hypothetical protein